MAKRIKEKALKRAAEKDVRPRAIARHMRISSRKVKIVIDQIRGKNVTEALAILTYAPKSAAPIVEKLLKSAIANAENNLELDRNNLYVAEVYANQGPTLKRMMPRAKGQSSAIHKRTSHIHIILDQQNK